MSCNTKETTQIRALYFENAVLEKSRPIFVLIFAPFSNNPNYQRDVNEVDDLGIALLMNTRNKSDEAIFHAFEISWYYYGRASAN